MEATKPRLTKGIYVAGPLFCEAEVAWRKHEGSLLNEFIRFEGRDLEVFNPIDLPVNSSNPTPADIFEADFFGSMMKSKYFFFDLNNEDSGTIMELGMVIRQKMAGEDLKIYPVISDIRLGSRDSVKYPAKGMNSFVIGSLDYLNIPIHKSFAEAFAQFVKDVKGE